MCFRNLIFVFLVLASSACGGSSGEDSDVFNNRLSLLSRWNELALEGVRNTGALPTITTRRLFIISAASYDAWTAYDDVATPVFLDPSLRRPVEEHTAGNKELAVSFAAYYSIINLFAEDQATVKDAGKLLASLGIDKSSSMDESSPEGLGFIAAMSALSGRQGDGANSENGYAEITSGTYPTLYAAVNSAENGPGSESFNPNHWQPLRVPTGSVTDERGVAVVDNNNPASFSDQEFLTPHWGAVQPFALSSGSQLRPQAPPMKGSSANYTDALGNISTNDEAWISQFNEVLEISANLTDTKKVIAEFWADGPRTEAPPGHWNQLAHGVSDRDAHGVDEDVKMYFALNAALLDAGIAVWEAKRHYDFIRPVSAIRDFYFNREIEAWAGPDLGTQIILGQNWRPYQNVTFVTPPFAEYVSGHSAFSYAAAEVLRLYTGADTFYDGVSVTVQDVNRDGKPDMLGEFIALQGSSTFEANTPEEDVVLRWPTFNSAAAEAGVSRLYGGIHIQDGDLRGREIGRVAGAQAFQKAVRMWSGDTSTQN